MLLSLEEFREEINYNPFHFWQLSGASAPVRSACNTLIAEYSWQNADAAGRADIRKAIEAAESTLTKYLGYSPGEQYFNDRVSLGCVRHFDWLSAVKLSSGRVVAVQTESYTELGTAALNFFDDDGDGIDDLFRITFADATTDPAAVELAFELDDVPARRSALEARFIRPITVTRLNAATLEITGPKQILVEPKKYESPVFEPLDLATAANFVSTAKLYKRVASAANSATLNYYNSAGALTTQAINITLCDAENGFIRLSDYACLDIPVCSCASDAAPVLAVNYRAGDDVDKWRGVITKLALANMARRLCACDAANLEIMAQQMDLALPVGPGLARIDLDSAYLSNPIGTRAGQIAAWKSIQDSRLQRGIFV